MTTKDTSDTWGNFETTFQLPPGFTDPILNLEVAVDDVGQIFLNGNQLPETGGQTTICNGQPQIVYTFTTTNPTLFQVGTNTLRFDVVNNPWSCAFSPTGRGGPGDAMNVEFEGTVTFTAPQPTCDGVPPDAIVGTDGNDILFGTPGPDFIVALAGADRILPLWGDDIICAGDGHDVVVDFGGNDTIFGEADVDVIFAGTGDDTLDGGLDGVVDYDFCLGGPGLDTAANCEFAVGIP